ncbi:MAG: hypothetical protein MJZ34_03145 [Paludibacteraceae bacterium]|nr:hypothetical protein [Paludibacteraceae bacterium]
MAIRVADTIRPMNNQDFPVVEGQYLEMTKSDGTTKRLQAMYDDGELGGGLKTETLSYLPAEGQTDRIYLIPNKESNKEDAYDEYVWTQGFDSRILTDNYGYYWEWVSNETMRAVYDMSSQFVSDFVNWTILEIHTTTGYSFKGTWSLSGTFENASGIIPVHDKLGNSANFEFLVQVGSYPYGIQVTTSNSTDCPIVDSQWQCVIDKLVISNGAQIYQWEKVGPSLDTVSTQKLSVSKPYSNSYSVDVLPEKVLVKSDISEMQYNASGNRSNPIPGSTIDSDGIHNILTGIGHLGQSSIWLVAPDWSNTLSVNCPAMDPGESYEVGEFAGETVFLSLSNDGNVDILFNNSVISDWSDVEELGFWSYLPAKHEMEITSTDIRKDGVSVLGGGGGSISPAGNDALPVFINYEGQAQTISDLNLNQSGWKEAHLNSSSFSPEGTLGLYVAGGYKAAPGSYLYGEITAEGVTTPFWVEGDNWYEDQGSPCVKINDDLWYSYMSQAFYFRDSLGEGVNFDCTVNYFQDAYVQATTVTVSDPSSTARLTASGLVLSRTDRSTKVTHQGFSTTESVRAEKESSIAGTTLRPEVGNREFRNFALKTAGWSLYKSAYECGYPTEILTNNDYIAGEYIFIDNIRGEEYQINTNDFNSGNLQDFCPNAQSHQLSAVTAVHSWDWSIVPGICCERTANGLRLWFDTVLWPCSGTDNIPDDVQDNTVIAAATVVPLTPPTVITGRVEANDVIANEVDAVHGLFRGNTLGTNVDTQMTSSTSAYGGAHRSTNLVSDIHQGDKVEGFGFVSSDWQVGTGYQSVTTKYSTDYPYLFLGEDAVLVKPTGNLFLFIKPSLYQTLPDGIAHLKINAEDVASITFNRKMESKDSAYQYLFPEKSGTVAMLSDIHGGGGGVSPAGSSSLPVYINSDGEAVAVNNLEIANSSNIAGTSLSKYAGKAVLRSDLVGCNAGVERLTFVNDTITDKTATYMDRTVFFDSKQLSSRFENMAYTNVMAIDLPDIGYGAEFCLVFDEYAAPEPDEDDDDGFTTSGAAGSSIAPPRPDDDDDEFSTSGDAGGWYVTSGNSSTSGIAGLD